MRVRNRAVAPLRSSAHGQQLYDPSGRGRSRCEGDGGRVQTDHAATLGRRRLRRAVQEGVGRREGGWGTLVPNVQYQDQMYSIPPPQV
jgi:hypothetical protein